MIKRTIHCDMCNVEGACDRYQLRLKNNKGRWLITHLEVSPNHICISCLTESFRNGRSGILIDPIIPS